MSGTKNYNLHLTDTATERFLDWRNKMNGTEDSNMIKIDTALGEKADSSVNIPCTLLASAWENDEQTVVVTGLTAEQNGVIGVAQNISEEQLKACYSAGLYIKGQMNDALVIGVNGTTPTIDIPANIILLG